MSEQILYPFCAIVGQERMKRALILNIINPALGGVLIRGKREPRNPRRYALWQRCWDSAGR